jgi:hypothetical protein
MPQQTNLNVSPYFDDFDPDSDFHRVLFKPGYPVQARELTGLQSMLQNQIEKFGKHFFKEGAKVIPGNTGYTQLFNCIQLNNTFQGVPVTAYADQLIGTKITGKKSGVTAVVETILYPQDSERNNLTLYVNYLSSNTQNNTTTTFSDGEELSSNVIITSGLLGNTTIAADTSFATTIASNAAATGSAFQIQDGVYFIRGNFVNVDTETLLLDQYTNTPSYRIGLYIDETIVNADMDESLNDNSQGFNNYAAPGADRLRISTRLFKKALDDFNDDNFVELAIVTEGVLQTQTAASTTYSSNFMEILARRTYAESGDYYVNPFDITVENSLNDNVGNRGIFQEGQFTPGGSTPSDDLALYKVSPGKAFVKGWEVTTISPVYLDVEKPRATATIEDLTFAYNTGPTLKINRVDGSPTIGIGNTYIVSLRDQRVGYTTSSLPGKEIGVARVYDYRLESGSYSTSNGNLNEWDISLYDVQTVTEIAVSTACTLTVPTFIKGKNSGATAFLKDAVTAGTALTVYETTGNFIPQESLVIDGIPDGRIAIAITEYGIGNVKSLYGTNNGVVGVNTFTADVIQSTGINVGIVTVSPASGANYISTVRTANPNFPGPPTNPLVRENDLVSFTDIAISPTDPIYGRVTSVSENDITITGITSVSGIVDGKLPEAAYEATDFKVLTTKLDSSSDNTLYTPLPKTNVSTVDLTDAFITIRKSQLVNITNNQLSAVVVAGENETFLPYDEERYALLRSDGTAEPLTSNAVEITLGSTNLQIQNLGANDTDAQLITTLKKVKPKAKVKIQNRVNSIVVNLSKLAGSGIGTTTLNNGLTYGNYPYGTRVEDDSISLNSPDVIEVHGVFEMATVPSEDNTNPSAPKMVLGSLTSSTTTTSEFVIGEQVIGQTSGAIAIVAEKLTDTQISFIHKNDISFKEGEVIAAQESLVEGTIVTLDSPSFNITDNFKINDGQKSTFLNYGSIIRKANFEPPEKKIKIYFSNGYYDTTDDGDITTVNSYDNFDYATQIAVVDEISESDIIDIRPRVSDYTVSENARSPLEFYGRTFNSSGQSATNPLASDGDIKVTFSYYQGRIDRIFVTKDGIFEVKYGTPSDYPDRPGPVDDAVEVARITLPPYLYNTSDAALEFLEHKRFRMVDIKRLEDRIKNLEYYTTLSLMEVNTANMFVPDADGLNRYKSGFFVDNFSSFIAQENKIGINNSIDRKHNEGRPLHYTNSVDMIFGPVTNPDPTADLQFASILENNVTKQNDTLTLSYTSVEWLKQHFATRSESVTPFLISFWQGSLELTPASDTWVDTVRLEAKIIQTEGNYNEVMNDAIEAGTVDPQTGFGPIIWNSWQTNWTGTDVTTVTRTRNQRIGWRGQGPGGRNLVWRGTLIDRTIRDTFRSRRDTGVRSRTGERTIITESFDEHSVGDRVVSRDLIPFMRARNVEFDAKRVKPLTRMYGFFDGVDVTKYCVPKLLEIQMNTGTFQVGEKVTGTVQGTGLGEETSKPRITFRVAQSNHREGEYDLPTKIYPESPYNNQILPESYSSTSTILNVDTYSLANEVQGEYWGWVETGMTLVGESSGATAEIVNLRLISDLAANLKGSYYIPNPNNINFPRFESGTKVFTLVNDDTNDHDVASTIAEESYTAAGTLETVQENIVSVRNARIERKQEFQERAVTRTTGLQIVGSQVIRERRQENAIVGWYDPLAQSFLVDEETGIFITDCDVFFRSKDDNDVPLVFQLRTMKNGYPTQHVIPFSEIVVEPGDITTSGDGSIATTIKMKAPVYLEGGQEYAICLASNSTKYSVYISRIGENDLLTQTYISNQPYLGSLFKSQNASTWEASQWEDLKFTLYRADFEESGSVELYNPQLSVGNNQIPQLLPDSLNMISRTVRVGLGTTVADPGLQVGQLVSQPASDATGRLIGVAGSATGSLTVSNAGIGYTPADGSRTVAGVNLVTLTGNGRGAVGSVSVTNGAISAATITGGGSGYQVGDVVGFTTLGVTSVGRDARLSIVSIGMTSELIVDGVQGDFTVGAAKTIQYTNSAGNTVDLNAGYGGNVQVSATTVDTDGLHIKVDHKNHGMYFADNLVEISNARSDVKPTKLSTPLDITNTAGSISVTDATKFNLFENVGVGTTNFGYLEIGGNGYGTGEIISYESVSGNNIGITTRGLNPTTYPVGTPIYKYELGGVSLKRINKIHNLSDPTVTSPITFDSYHIRVDMSQDGTNRNVAGYPSLYLNATKSAGGQKTRATQNMPFEILTPVVQNVSVRGTSITGEVRTITSQSIDGNEIPFLDAGFESITPNTSNFFHTPRMIASKINEDLKLGTLAGNKSMNMRLFLNTTDSRLSPVIDAQRLAVITTSNRVNNVITDYASDSRVNGIDTDPTACRYISKEVILENSASALKILVDAHINVNCDIRAFYSISNTEGGTPIFTPFPGFNNLNGRGQVIAVKDNDGQSDIFIPKVNSTGFESGDLEFTEYVFTADQLPSFRTYRIKLVLTSSSQVYVPRMKKLRVMALA